MDVPKTCTKCGVPKPTSEFYKHAIEKDGLRSQCKSCQEEYKAAYRRKHHDQIAAYQTAYHLAHRDSIHARKAARGGSTPYRYSPERERAKWHRRRARKMGAGGSYTTADIERIREAQGGRCCYCGADSKLTIEHILPLSRGGTNWPDNIALACLSCNSSKGTKLPTEWRK